MTLVKRIFREKRLFAVPLLLLLLVNVGVYAFVVNPLVRRAAGAADRAAAAARGRAAAERDQVAAAALLEGQGRAREELATFYDKVLPADFVAARRMTYTRLPELAKKANVRYEAGSFEIDQTLKTGRVGRLHTKMVLQGDYESFRRFVFELETAADFLIIDGVALAQGEVGKPLTLNLEVSTYIVSGPMEPERRNKIVLGVLGLVLAGVAFRTWMPQSGTPSPASNGTTVQAPPGQRSGTPAFPSTDVHLKALDADRPKPGEGARNLFRFKPKPPPPPPPPPPPRVVAPPPVLPPVPTGPPPVPPPPPIVLKFIGMVQSADKSQRLAVLSDGKGGIPMYGKEGDIIEGRYRILKIGAESIEMAYLDGRGRQTIRLSGG